MTVEVQPPRQRRSWRRPMMVAASVLVLAVMAGGLWWAERDDPAPPEPSPAPTPTATAGPSDSEREAALVYLDWILGRQVAECFTDAGFEREPFLSAELVRVPRVAAFLQVEAATEDPSLPTPDLRWAAQSGPGDPGTPPSRQLFDPDASESCLPGAPALRLPEVTSARTVVDEAMGDDDFLAALGEYVWAAQHPGAVLLAEARIGDSEDVTTDDQVAQEGWEALVHEVAAAAEGELVVTAVEATDQYGQVGGVTELGDGAVLRVASPDFAMVHVGRSSVEQRCGPVVLSVAVADQRGALIMGSAGLVQACSDLERLLDVPGGERA